MKQQIVPHWVKKRVSINSNYMKTLALLQELSINTVCESAVCPNIYECFCKNYATFMILGKRCTRNCRFCGVTQLSGETDMPVDLGETFRIADAVKTMKMRYVVITSPTRDDLLDGGASQFEIVTKLIKAGNPSVKVELLIPDFKGSCKSMKTVTNARPDILSHNIETVASLYPSVRPKADYHLSLNLLKDIKKNRIIAKSGFMLGLGETRKEVLDLMDQIRQTGCDYLVIGQYLKPSKEAIDVSEFIHPDIFKEYEEIGKRMEFKNVFAGTFYRSSYMAEKLVD